jgi:hypothetical protein
MMSSSLQYFLTVGPLAFYFFVLGVWQTGRRPRVVLGPTDVAMLAFGLGGLLVFGPIGHWLVDRLFPGPSVWAWLALPSLFCLLVLLWIPRAARRLVIYNVDRETLERALGEIIGALPVDFARTPHGYLDTNAGRTLNVEVGQRSRIAVIEAKGKDADAVIRAIARELHSKFRRVPARPTRLSRLWFVLAVLAMLPSFGLYFARHEFRAAVQSFFHRIQR